MGKELILDKIYKICNGINEGYVGVLISYNAVINEAILELDEYTRVITTSENLEIL